MALPLVSIIIPTYNGQKYVSKAIASVLGQSYEHIEIIIIDDASSDATAGIITALVQKDARIISIKNEKNLGFVKSLRSGIAKAKGNYIARLDDDDTWIDKDKLKKQVDFLEKNPEYVLVGGGVCIIREIDGKEVVRYLFPKEDAQIRNALLMYNVFSHSSVLFLTSCYVAVGGYDETFGFFADADLWLKMGGVGKLYNFQEYFTEYLDKEDGVKKYSMRDKQIRRKLFLRIYMKWRYRKQYPHIVKAIFFCIGSYAYSFLPLKAKIKPILFKLRTMILPAPYKYLR